MNANILTNINISRKKYYRGNSKSVLKRCYEACIHEAAHAIIAYSLGMKIYSIKIHWHKNPPYAATDLVLWDNVKEYAAAVLMAGWAADTIINKKLDCFSKSIGASADYKMYKKLKLKRLDAIRVKKTIIKEVGNRKDIIIQLANCIFKSKKNKRINITHKKLYKWFDRIIGHQIHREFSYDLLNIK